MRSLTAAALTVAFALSGCGSDDGESPSVESAASLGASTEEAQTARPTDQAKSATEIGDAIKTQVADISKVVTITEDNDPNDKIGRPGGYVDGAVMFDSRAEPSNEEPGADQGAFLEVWPDEAAATDRSKFIQGTLKASDGILGSEYHYQHEGYLLRVTGELKPSEAKAYQTAFDAQF